MNCYNNKFKNSTIFVCVHPDYNNINVSLKGQPGETTSVRGYVEFILEIAPEGRDVWVEEYRYPAGLWANSLSTDKTATLKRRGLGEDYCRVIAKIYSDEKYKNLMGIVSTNAFYG